MIIKYEDIALPTPQVSGLKLPDKDNVRQRLIEMRDIFSHVPGGKTVTGRIRKPIYMVSGLKSDDGEMLEMREDEACIIINANTPFTVKTALKMIF